MSRLDQATQMNPEFATALAHGEGWALECAQQLEELDNPTRRHPDRARKEDGKKRKWCNGCPFEEGCVCCDLD